MSDLQMMNGSCWMGGWWVGDSVGGLHYKEFQ